MVQKTINISVPPAMADFIEREVESGQFASTSDFFRTLIREYQAIRNRSYSREELIKAIQDGANSGESTPMDMDAIIAEAERRYQS